MNITFIIKDENTQRVIDAIKGFYSIPQIPDPAWVDPQNGSQPPMVNQFTDNQWAKEKIRRFILDVVRRYEITKAKEAVNVQVEDNLIQ